MLRLPSDENVENHVARGLVRHLSTVDLIRAVDRRDPSIGRRPEDLLSCRAGQVDSRSDPQFAPRM